MMTVAHPRSWLPVLLLCACGGAQSVPVSEQSEPRADAPGRHVIRLSRPFRVGDTYGVEIVASSEQRTTIHRGGGSETEDIVRTLELRGTAHVLAVNAAGEETTRDIEIERCVASDPIGQQRAIAPPGSILRVVVPEGDDEELSIVLLGGQLSEDDIETLSIGLSTSDGSDDHVFGTDAPQRIGASWPIDPALLMPELRDVEFATFRPDQVSGRTTLRAQETVDGVPCLLVGANVDAHGFSVQIGERPRTDHSLLRAEFEAALPLDPAVPRIRNGEHLHIELRMRILVDGEEARVEIVMNKESRSTFRR